MLCTNISRDLKFYAIKWENESFLGEKKNKIFEYLTVISYL